MTHTVWLHRLLMRRLHAMTTSHNDENRQLDPNKPVAIDDVDPGNSDPDDFTEPLDPDDNIYSLVLPDDSPAETDK